MKYSCLFLFSLLTAFAAPGCGNDTLEKMERVKERTCACEDRACVAKLVKETRTLESEMTNLSEAEHKKATAIAMATMECATRDF